MIEIHIQIQGGSLSGDANYVGDCTEQEKALGLEVLKILQKLSDVSAHSIVFDKPLKASDRHPEL